MSLDYRIFRPFLRFVSPVGGACRSGTVVRRSRQVVLIACMALLHLAGCRREEGIRQYTVKRTESPARSIAAPSATQEGVAWFVKLTGPADAVRLQAEPFAKVVQTFTAPADGNPRFDIPSGWKASEGPPPRYQTLTISGTDPPLEVTVSALPLSTADLDEYFLANINRWRGQLELPPMEGSDWKVAAEANGEFRAIPSTDRSVAMVHLTGKTKEFGESRMLGAIIVPRANSTAEKMPAPVSNDSGPLTYKLPEGWSVSPGNSMRLGSFQAGTAESPVDVSVTRFPGGGDILANINRWRGQVKLDPIDDQALAAGTERITIDGREATFAEMIGEETGILAAILEEGDAKWFFKAQGPKDSIVSERQKFREFLNSVKFNSK